MTTLTHAKPLSRRRFLSISAAAAGMAITPGLAIGAPAIQRWRGVALGAGAAEPREDLVAIEIGQALFLESYVVFVDLLDGVLSMSQDVDMGHNTAESLNIENRERNSTRKYSKVQKFGF